MRHEAIGGLKRSIACIAHDGRDTCHRTLLVVDAMLPDPHTPNVDGTTRYHRVCRAGVQPPILSVAPGTELFA